MSAPGDVPNFDHWLQEVSYNPDAPVDEPGIVSPGWHRWLHRFFEREGPMPRDVVKRAAMTHQLALANEAANAVLADVHRTTAFRPVVEVDIWMESSIRISIDGGSTAPSMLEVEQPQSFAEVADYFQEQLDQSPLGCWPECTQHGVGLHPEVHDGRAVWWCRLGSHSVAPIGELGSSR